MNGRSVGKIVEDKRKELGLTLEECSKKTRISKKFLEAIETDNYDAFPGEVYYLGFLRNYAQILSLDANKLIHDYQKQKKIEEPAPLEELTKPLKKEIKLPTINRNSFPMILIVVITIIVIIGIILVFTLPKQEKLETTKTDVKVKQQKNENEFILVQRRTIKTFTSGQILIIPDGEYQYKINILSINKDDKTAQINISNFQSPFSIKEKDLIKFDFNENSETDLQILVNQVTPNGVILTIERLTSDKGKGSLTENNLSIIYSEQTTVKPEDNQLTNTPNQISVVIQANRNGYVRLESDTEGVLEKFLSVGETLKIGGSKQVVFQITNANHMSVLINNNQIQLPKEFAIYCIVKWVFDQKTNQYSLVTEFKK